MKRTRVAALALSTVLGASVLGVGPAALAGTASAAASTCVTDLTNAQTANAAAIAADQVGNTALARTNNVATGNALNSALIDCLSQPLVVDYNVVAAEVSVAAATVFNSLGSSGAALAAEQSAASSITQALANAS
jgi:hypothetical protein